MPSFTERKCVFKVFDSTKVDEEDLLVYTSLFVPVIHSQKKIYLYFFFFSKFHWDGRTLGWKLPADKQKKENSIFIHCCLIASLKSIGMKPGCVGKAASPPAATMKVGTLDTLNKYRGTNNTTPLMETENNTMTSHRVTRGIKGCARWQTWHIPPEFHQAAPPQLNEWKQKKKTPRAARSCTSTWKVVFTCVTGATVWYESTLAWADPNRIRPLPADSLGKARWAYSNRKSND